MVLTSIPVSPAPGFEVGTTKIKKPGAEVTKIRLSPHHCCNMELSIIYTSELWNPHLFIADPDPIFFLKAHQDPALHNCVILTSFLWLTPISTDNWASAPFSIVGYRYLFLNINKIIIITITISLQFLYFLLLQFCGSGSRKESECGSMQIRIHSPEIKILPKNLRYG